MASANFIDECNKEIMRLSAEIDRIKQLTNYLKGGITKEKTIEEVHAEYQAKQGARKN